MRTLLLLAALGASASALAQNPDVASPAGMSSTTRMSDTAVMKASSALKQGKALTLTVDSRSVPYTAKMFGKMLYVPVRFFSETGQRVTWQPADLRATLHDDNTPMKKTVDYDAKRGQSSYQASKSMRPVYVNGRLWVPLASGLAAFGLLAEWVPTSSRLNVKTNR